MLFRLVQQCRYLHTFTALKCDLTEVQKHKLSGVQIQCIRSIMRMTNSDEASQHGRPSEIERSLKACKFPLEKGITCWRCTCPVPNPSSSTPTKKSMSTPKTFFVNIKTGIFINYEQRISGSWRMFQDFLDVLRGIRSVPVVTSQSNIFLPEEQYEELNKAFNAATRVGDLSSNEFNIMCKTFNLKELQIETFKFFDVRVNDDRNTLLFPFYDPSRMLSGIKKVSPARTHEKEIKYVEGFIPSQSTLSIFGGGNSVHRNQTEVVLAGSVLDAMAITQETNILAVALPKKCWPLPVEVLPWFEKFERITLWLGTSLAEWEATKNIAKKLGQERCYFIRPSEFPLSALGSLQAGYSIFKTLLKAEAIAHKSITSFSYLKNDVLQELCHSEQVAGVKWSRFPGMNKLLKGLRPGELTIFTGPTGSGKTTFMSEYSLDLCMKGVVTLWGSFEIRNVRLAKLMITQFSQSPLEKNVENFEMWSEQFEQLPLFFMTLHGQHNVTKVLQVMEHAVYVHDIQHVIVDNLQFMMGMQEVSDRFHRQDLIVAAFRRFATQNNCHVTLVMHPRKENESEELTNNSIAGGAKASQEADNIIILQDRKLNMLRRRKYIQVTKNRFDGDLGAFLIEFDKDLKSFVTKKRFCKVPSAANNENNK